MERKIWQYLDVPYIQAHVEDSIDFAQKARITEFAPLIVKSATKQAVFLSQYGRLI